MRTVLISQKFKKLLQITQLKLVLIIKNNNECEWDPMKLTSYTICTSIFFFNWPDDGLFGLKLVANNRNNKIKYSCNRWSTYFISF